MQMDVINIIKKVTLHKSKIKSKLKGQKVVP